MILIHSLKVKLSLKLLIKLIKDTIPAQPRKSKLNLNNRKGQPHEKEIKNLKKQVKKLLKRKKVKEKKQEKYKAIQK